MTRTRIWISLILLYYLIVATLYAVAVPLFEASDEAEHFIHIHQILATGDLPIIQSGDDMANQTDSILRWNNQAHHAPLYYMTSSMLVSWSERADLADYLQPNELIFLRNTVEDNPNKWLHRYTDPTSDTHIAVYVLRAMNILIGLSTLLMVYRATKQLTDNRLAPLLATLLTASIPTFIVVNTSVTNDALVIFLYSAGIYWALRIWRTETITWRDTAIISLILAGIALTKLTGVTLFGVIYLALLIGAFQKKWHWRDLFQVGIVSGLTTLALSGWWYWRNFTLYGDPLALDATSSIWGRTSPFALSMLPEELLRIGKSFWMLIGYLHYPVFAPNEFYVYAGIITVIGLIGFFAFWRKSDFHGFWILWVACAVVSGMLLYGTISVDISYGRLLHPAIAGFVPILILGWLHIFKRFSLLLILPISLINLLIPLIIVPTAYPTLTPVDTIPSSATQVNWQADTLEILAIDVANNNAIAGDTLPIDVYFRGNHPTNPAMIITAVDTIRAQRFDHIEIYPGMADMRELPDDQIYRAQVNFEITQSDDIRAPRMINILLEWVDLDTNTALVFDSGLSLLEVQANVYVDDRYQPPEVDNQVFIRYADEINLLGYTAPDSASAGENIDLTFIWDSEPRNSEAILTIQLFDAENELIYQEDGILWWYPTQYWVSVPFGDTRTLQLPDDLPAGEYTYHVGWYRTDGETFTRLPISIATQQDNLYILPTTLTITEE